MLSRAEIIQKLVHQYAKQYGRYGLVDASARSIGLYKFRNKDLAQGVEGITGYEIWQAAIVLQQLDVSYEIMNAKNGDSWIEVRMK